MTLRVLIADDEPEMRLVLRKALSGIKDVEIAGEACDGAEAVALAEKLRPDCVFMDIEMPNTDGVAAASKMIDTDPKLIIVFITAYSDYMPQAYELYIFDYMMKPFKLERLTETVERIRLLKQREKAVRPVKKIQFKTKDGIVFLAPGEIVIIQRENRSTVVIGTNGRYTILETLSEAELLLPQGIFLRSHKSYIINKTKISHIRPYGRWTFVAEFDGVKEDALITSEKEKEIGKR